MAKTRKILLLPGDGIGPEVIAEVRKILEWMNKAKSLDIGLIRKSLWKSLYKFGFLVTGVFVGIVISVYLLYLNECVYYKIGVTKWKYYFLKITKGFQVLLKQH